MSAVRNQSAARGASRLTWAPALLLPLFLLAVLVPAAASASTWAGVPRTGRWSGRDKYGNRASFRSIDGGHKIAGLTFTVHYKCPSPPQPPHHEETKPPPAPAPEPPPPAEEPPEEFAAASRVAKPPLTGTITFHVSGSMSVGDDGFTPTATFTSRAPGGHKAFFRGALSFSAHHPPSRPTTTGSLVGGGGFPDAAGVECAIGPRDGYDYIPVHP